MLWRIAVKKFDARFACLTSALAIALAGPASAQSPKVGDPPEAKDMRLVGMSDLQARSAYQPTIHKQGDRTIAYIGHHGGTPEVPKPLNPLTGQAEFNGTSIIDVTDPSKPKYLFHIPGQAGNFEAGGAQMTRVCDGSALPKGDRNAVYLLRTFGGAGHEIWNVADPSKPVLVSKPSWNLKDTHKSWWECDTGIAYLVSGVDGWRSRRMTEVFDLSDPAKPVKIRDFGLVGQEPGTSGTVPTDLHGMISTGPQGNRIYFGYGTNESRPMVVSNFNVPEASGNFCGRGGRFGSHSANESTAPVFHKKVAFFTWFNGGVRAVDIRNPYQPKEIGYFIPSITEATDKRCVKVDGQDRCKIAIQSNNLETDERGYVYVVDRANTGMHILELTGEARKVAGQP